MCLKQIERCIDVVFADARPRVGSFTAYLTEYLANTMYHTAIILYQPYTQDSKQLNVGPINADAHILADCIV